MHNSIEQLTDLTPADITHEVAVGQVVALDYRTASIFEKYGIDFCCKGNISIEAACERKSIRTEDVMRDIKVLMSNQTGRTTDYTSWSPVLLADYIEAQHHSYVEKNTPVLIQYLDKLCNVHGARHPELFEINSLFKASAAELAQHMKKEELILFPMIRKLSANASLRSNDEQMSERKVDQPIQMMMQEHDNEGERFRKIDELSNHYQPPADACNTYKVTYSLLQEFENDLHLHIHLENNILFPKAIAMQE